MDPSQTSYPQRHEAPLRRIIALLFFTLLVATLSSLGTYYFLNKQFKAQLESDQQIINMLSTTKIPTQAEDLKLELKICSINKGKPVPFIKNGKFIEEYILKSEDGSRTARAVVDPENGYINYNQLFVDNKLVIDNAIKYYETFGLLPLYWSLDNNTLYLLTSDVANHGYQKSTEIYTFNRISGRISFFLSLPANETDMLKTCGDIEYLLVANSIGGGNGFFDPPHRITLVDLKTGTLKTIYENSSVQVNAIHDLKLNALANEVTFIEDTYSKEVGYGENLSEGEKPQSVPRTIKLTDSMKITE